MRDLRDYTQLLRVLDNGYLMTHQEIPNLASRIRKQNVVDEGQRRNRPLDIQQDQPTAEVDHAESSGSVAARGVPAGR